MKVETSSQNSRYCFSVLQTITVIVDYCKNARLIQLGDELIEEESECKISGKIRGTD